MITALLIIILTGATTLSFAAKKYDYLTFFVLSIPMGLGIVPLLMFAANLCGVPLTAGLIGTITILYSFILLYTNRKKPGPTKVKWSSFGVVHLCWLLFVVAGMFFASWKCLYWPPMEYDTVLGYDFVARGIAHEHTLSNSVVTNQLYVISSGPRMYYPPLLSLDISWFYMNGSNGKFPIMLLCNSWIYLVTFFIYKNSHSLLAGLMAAFFILMTPELYSHMTLSLTNLPVAVYISLSFLLLLSWQRKRDIAEIVLAVLLVGFAVFTRSDAIIFIPAMLLFIWLYGKGLKARLATVSLLLFPLILYISWSYYIHLHIPLSQGQFFIRNLFWDQDKLIKVWGWALKLWSQTGLYGITFYVFAAMALFDIVRRKADVRYLLFYTISLFLYTMIYYQIDDSNGTLFSDPGGWMPSGYKRGMFTFAALSWIYIFNSKFTRYWIYKVEKYIS